MKKLLALCVALALVVLASASVGAWTIQDGTDYLNSPTITGPVTFTDPIQAEPATDAITAAQCNGRTIVNTGATGAVVYTLPVAVAGMVCTVVLTAAQDVDVNPNGTDRILVATNANGDALSSDATIGSGITLLSVAANQWMVVGSLGTWTDAN